MTFEEILDQAIAMLQRRGRVTYRLLQRQFQLDDGTLSDLLAELRYAHGEVISEDEQGMVWSGGAAVLPTPPPSVPQPFQPSVSQKAPVPQADGTPTTPSMPDAERRQLTVMFCDLVDSTTLSGQLDPEEYRDVVRQYQRVCTEVIQRFDGHIAQYLGDGLLVYFGYPQAHEDDTQRAVRAGLGILDAMGALQSRLQHEKGIPLALRVGVHTGLVVVGEMGSRGRHEQLALGATPNIAARIQGLAQPNTLMISAVTYRLIQGYFKCQDWGAQILRGVSEPVHVYHVLQESGARGRLDVAVTRELTPLVGRESEVTLLLERWEQVKAGQGQVVLLSGDAGIGKSRLVQMLKEHVANESHTLWECRSLSYFENTALFPLTDLFQRLLRFQAADTPDTKLEKLISALSQYRLPLEESVQLFAPLLSLPIPEDTYPPLQLSPQRQRQKALEAIVAILQALAEHQPVLFILEDLHWADPTTLEWLNLVLDQTPTASLLVLLTCRPHFQPAWHHRSYLTEITVNRLSHAQVEQIVNRMTDGKTFPQEVLAQIVEKTDGVPLFVEEITKASLESGQLKARDGYYELTGAFSTFTIPATLHDSLTARLDRLVTAKAVAQYAAVIGRQFSYDLLQAVTQLDEVMLQHELGRLVEAEIVYQRGLPPQATYTFKHALIQDAAYQSLLKSTRQQYHQRIAQVLEERFPETTQTQPELLAYHYTAAGLAAQAIPYWQRAGARALQRSAYTEASGHLTRGLELLTTLPDTSERVQQELGLQITLGPALSALKGFSAPEVGRTYARARELCRQMGGSPQLFPVLCGLWGFYAVRGEYRTARELGEQLLSLAQGVQDPVHLLEAHRVLAGALLHLGELTASRAHAEQGIALYDPQQHHGLSFHSGDNAGVACHFIAALVQWLLGYPDQALQRSQEALRLVQTVAHPFSRAFALIRGATLHQYLREAPAAQGLAGELIELARTQGFTQRLLIGLILQGWALTEQGQAREGMAHMRQGLAAFQATGAQWSLSYYLALLAEAHGKVGETAEGVRLLAEAWAAVESQDERYWEAELHRLQGDLRLRQVGSPVQTAEAEVCWQRALAIARHQQARSLELRAAMSLARLWQQQGKRAAARELLAPVYGWFTEGFDTADLQEAKALLEALA